MPGIINITYEDLMFQEHPSGVGRHKEKQHHLLSICSVYVHKEEPYI